MEYCSFLNGKDGWRSLGVCGSRCDGSSVRRFGVSGDAGLEYCSVLNGKKGWRSLGGCGSGCGYVKQGEWGGGVNELLID